MTGINNSSFLQRLILPLILYISFSFHPVSAQTYYALDAGIPPFTYSWSDGSSNDTVTNVSAGPYTVTVMDGNGCASQSEIILDEPDLFSIILILTDPDCNDPQNNNVSILPDAGISPIRYSLDNEAEQQSPFFQNLMAGSHEVKAEAANNCVASETFAIRIPQLLEVDLGPDRIILPGDSVVLNAAINQPLDSIVQVSWSSLQNTICPHCLVQTEFPLNTTTYFITITTAGGCMVYDSVTINVQNNIDIYIPYIFSPNGDQVNDLLIISGGQYVAQIESFTIYDKWGNVVFTQLHFMPGEPSSSWDGTRSGKALNPGVFTYRMIIDFKDDRQEIRSGDITLLR